jgi:hypothetical protein
MSKTGYHVATLSCRSRINGERHKVAFHIAPPGMGELIWCVRCCEMSRVVYAPYEYKGRCEDCRYKPSRGTVRSRVRASLDSHARHTGHAVTLLQGRGTVIQTWSAARENSSEKVS